VPAGPSRSQRVQKLPVGPSRSQWVQGSQKVPAGPSGCRSSQWVPAGPSGSQLVPVSAGFPAGPSGSRWVLEGVDGCRWPWCLRVDCPQGHSRCGWPGVLGAVPGAWRCSATGTGAPSATTTGGCRTRRWSAGSWAARLLWPPRREPGSERARVPSGSTGCGAGALRSAWPCAGTEVGGRTSAPTKRTPAPSAQVTCGGAGGRAGGRAADPLPDRCSPQLTASSPSAPPSPPGPPCRCPRSPSRLRRRAWVQRAQVRCAWVEPAQRACAQGERARGTACTGTA